MSHPSEQRLRTLALQARAFRFAKTVINVYSTLGFLKTAERALWSHLVETCASVVANLEEADEASSDADFIAKMKITLRETRESRVRLRLLLECRLAGHDQLGPLQNEALQLASIFATIVVNTKRRVAEEKQQRRCMAGRRRKNRPAPEGAL